MPAPAHRPLAADQWMCLLDFSRTVAEDLHAYDANSAWPLMLDEFAAWRKQQLDPAPMCGVEARD